MKEHLKSVSMVVTSLLTSLHDTTIEGLNKGFKVASDQFEKIIKSCEWIFDNTNMILEILLEEHHSIVVMVVAGTMSLLVVLVLIQTGYMIKLTKEIKNRKLETETMQKSLKNLEESVNKLTHIIINFWIGVRPPVSMVISPKYHPSPNKESISSYTPGYPSVPSWSGHALDPSGRQNNLY